MTGLPSCYLHMYIYLLQHLQCAIDTSGPYGSMFQGGQLTPCTPGSGFCCCCSPVFFVASHLPI